MSQAFYPTNDGHVGNLQKLTDIQLSDILNRQERLLKKKSFLSHLPDKGKKVKEHYEIIKQEMDRRQSLLQARVKCETRREGRPIHERVSSTSGASSVTQAEEECTVGESLEDRLVSLSIQDSDMEEGMLKHQYQIAMDRAKENLSAGLKREPFKLNRKLHITKISDLPEDIKKTKETMHISSVHHMTDKAHVIEESAVAPPSYKFDSAQQIDISESLQLQQSQKQRQEELQAVLAAERLAERLHIKTEPYNPEGVDMSYRGRQEELDSDDDGEEDDVTNQYAVEQLEHSGDEKESETEQ